MYLNFHNYLNTNSINCVPAVTVPAQMLLYPIHSPQTSQIQFLEEDLTGLYVGLIPYGPPTLHRDKMTPPPPPLLDCTVLYYTLLYIGVLYISTSREIVLLGRVVNG